MGKNENNNSIPFVKPTRVGNFKIWRNKVALTYMPELNEEQKKQIEERKGKVKKQKVDIEAINVSNLDGSWSVKIPQTFEMFGMLTIAYQWLKSEDAEERRRGEGFIRTALSNMAYVSMVCNGFFHHGIEMIASVYANPTLLQDTDEGAAFMEDAKDTVERFLAWREEYDKHVAENEPTEQDIHQEDIAEEAMEILSEGEKKE